MGSRSPTPRFSILVALVSTCARERVLELLEALRQQEGGHRQEVILCDRRDDEVSGLISSEYPEAIRISVAPDQSIPAMQLRALRQARGELVVVTEDHCVPEPGWLSGFARAFDEADADPEAPPLAAVGGSVANGEASSRLDRATFFCEYLAFQTPLASGEAGALPGMNVCYRRSVLAGLDDRLLASGFWETVAQPRLRAAGGRLLIDGAIRVRHCKAIPLALFTTQRFLYSRYFAGSRFGPGRSLARAFAALSSPLLVPLILSRQARQAAARPGIRSQWLGALGYLSWFAVVAAAGEAVGYALGPGDALRRLE